MASKAVHNAYQQTAIAGFPEPSLPYSYVHTVEDLKHMNAGTGAAANAYKLMCESTITVADSIHVPPDL